MKMAGQRVTGQAGFSLIEVLVTALILATAIVGLTLMLSRGQAYVVDEGATRIALYLAEEKIEKLRGLGLGGASVAKTPSYNPVTDAEANAGCPNEPCYNEANIRAGTGLQTPTNTEVDTQTFTRLTCVRYVRDDDPEQPPDPLEPPSSWNCTSCDVATSPSNCGSTGDKSCCSFRTKRIKVAVIPTLLGGANASTAVDPNRVTVETVLTPIPKP